MKAIDFLHSLYVNTMLNEYIQFVFISPHRRQVISWSEANTMPGYSRALAKAQKLNDQGYGVYYRVCTMAEPTVNNIRGGEVASVAVPAFWIDIDSVKNGDRIEDDIAKLKESATPPTVVVNTGGGVHAYWVLEEPVVLDDETRPIVKSILRGLTVKFGADPAPTHTAAVLRVPGFKNTKRERANSAITAEVVGPRTTFNAMKLFTVYDEVERKRGKDNGNYVPRGDGQLPYWVETILNNPPAEGQGKYGGRDNAFYAVACWLFGEKKSDMEVRSTIEGPALSSGLKSHDVDRIVRSASKYRAN